MASGVVPVVPAAARAAWAAPPSGRSDAPQSLTSGRNFLDSGTDFYHVSLASLSQKKARTRWFNSSGSLNFLSLLESFSTEPSTPLSGQGLISTRTSSNSTQTPPSPTTEDGPLGDASAPAPTHAYDVRAGAGSRSTFPAWSILASRSSSLSR